MKRTKSLHFVALCLFIISLSCKKEMKFKIDEPTPKIDEPILPEPIEKAIYVPIKLEAEGLNMNLKYKDDSALLTEITDSNGSKTIITYNAENYPQKMEKFKNGTLIFIAFFEQNDQSLINKINSFDVGSKSNWIPNGYCMLTYDELLKISFINYHNNNHGLIKTSNLRYNESSNLSEINATNPVSTTTYTFDQKKGISSNIPFIDIFIILLDHWFLPCSNNNILTRLNQESSEEQTNLSYEYDKNGYPSSATLTQAKNKQTITITYKHLEQ